MPTIRETSARARSWTTRRDFLKIGGLSGAVWAWSDGRPSLAAAPRDERALILLLLVGGPSQLETWDPKPAAPTEIRGPFRSIATRVPGVRVSEHLPHSASRMDRLVLVRSLHHDAAPIHETGHQLIQTGRICRSEEDYPHVGAVTARLLGSRGGVPPFVLIPGPIGNTGVGISHGQSSGLLGEAYDPCLPAVETRPGADRGAAPAQARTGGTRSAVPSPLRRAFDVAAETPATRQAYGETRFGRNCLRARRLVEAGVRVVTVNMYETVFNTESWDCHGSGPFASLADYKDRVLPTFDRAFSALLDDLQRRGRLDTTLVVATGEFGRTPKLNGAGGRDHWPGVWSAALAGGGLPGGSVIGSSDVRGAEPASRPLTPADLVATMYQGLGIDPATKIPTADGGTLALVESGRPIGGDLV